MDFMMVSTRTSKKGNIEIYPKFIVRSSKDLMIRGGDFYAIWNPETNLWSTDEETAINLIDKELDEYAEKFRKNSDDNVRVLHVWDAETGIIDKWHKYCQKQMPANRYHALDETIIFGGIETKKEDYASKQVSYPLEKGDISAYDELISTLYDEDERHKIEWAIGAIVTGDSKKLQKFLVMYGAAGTGKSTILNIIQMLFEGYYSVFEAKVLGQANNAFALEAFKSNPLVAIEHDGDLSRIEDNTRLNSVVSHELMTVNEKFKSTYSSRFNAFLFMGTNKPVKITDAKSGILRRLIDVSPTGNKVPRAKYERLMKEIEFELGAIAYHCMEVYLENPGIYDGYVPTSMMSSTNDFYNFVLDNYEVFVKEDGVTLKAAFEMYKTYCEESNIGYPLSKRLFKDELMNYFNEYVERETIGKKLVASNYFKGFIYDKFAYKSPEEPAGDVEPEKPKIIFSNIESAFDAVCGDCPAQYATADEKPEKAWANVNTKLSDLDTSKIHYVRVPENHIVIDFDIPDPITGMKSFELNLEEASKWPATYAELSKSGAGIHLHYIYNGDPTQLSRIYDDHIEIKVFTGKSSLRRKLTQCNNLPIASISSGLPMKGVENVVNFDSVKNEKGIRTLILRNLKKEYHNATKPSVDFIYKILDDAYNSGMKYDVSDMYQNVWAFAAKSTHQSDACLKLVRNMKFKSDEPSEDTGTVSSGDYDKIVFYDVEVFPNLFIINWKYQGEGHPVVRMINPTASEVEELMKYKLVGFNCRRYDNHILYGRLLGLDNMGLYHLSKRIVEGDKDAFYGEAYNVSYTDVYDFAAKKQSLKKWEIELGFFHLELGLPWDQPVPEELWERVAEYCDNDVLATEAVFDHLKGDFIARQILADVAGMSVNSTTNSLTTRIIFGSNKQPQSQFNYRNLAEPTDEKPYFPGYEFKLGKSYYKGFETGEGGFVWAKPGMYERSATFDVASMHPSSVIAENLFGDEYTKRFKDILDARIAIKHKDFDKAKKMLNGALAKYLDDESQAKALAQALKIAINSVYGLTSAKFPNPFKDPRNIDNIVAKRGALFMIDLKEELDKLGAEVFHIKTDSIKIANPTPEIEQFVLNFGKKFGYNFEIEHIFEKICLVNDAVYIAKLAEDDEEWIADCKKAEAKGEPIPTRWTATGTQFAVPYVFKNLFSKEPIEFQDMCETKSVTSELYLDMNEGCPDVSEYEKVAAIRTKTQQGAEDFKLTRKESELLEKYSDATDEEIAAEIAKGHNYQFVGKVGSFCPIKPNCGGGILYAYKDGKYSAATGTKGYRWMESEMVKNLEKQEDIDKSYYQEMVDKAVETISGFGDFEWFVDPAF